MIESLSKNKIMEEKSDVMVTKCTLRRQTYDIVVGGGIMSRRADKKVLDFPFSLTILFFVWLFFLEGVFVFLFFLFWEGVGSKVIKIGPNQLV